MSKKDERLAFSFKDFFVEKLSFENNKLLFGSNNRIEEISKVISKDIKDISKKTKNNYLPNQILTDDEIAEIAIAFNFEFEKIDDVSEENVLNKISDLVRQKDFGEKLQVVDKSPIITIMGHVDHGKTTLLDTIRKSNLASKETGAITQTIGAYQIEWEGKKLTFIDTPGHEAFSEMRASGSQITDIVIIVAAADDSLMPQTKESIDHAKSAGVPIIVAINKTDAPGADIEKVKQEMTDYDLMPEEWGGETPFIPLSALKNENIDTLLNTINLTAELQEKKVPSNILATGVVVESEIDPKQGNLVSVIVENGILKVGDDILIDDSLTRIKALTDDNGNRIKEAFASTPVQIFGLGSSPRVGSRFSVVSDMKDAKKVQTTINDSKLALRRRVEELSPEELFAKLADKNKRQINVLLKTESLGTQEAISSKLEDMSSDEVIVNIVHKSIGNITNSDINLANATSAEVIAFNVKAPKNLDLLIKEKLVLINEFDLIYKLFEYLEEKVSGLEEPKFEEIKNGSALVQQVFSFSKVGKIAGIIVQDGTIKSKSIAKVIRDGEEIAIDKIETLKTGKDDVKERQAGKEGGIVFENFDDIKEGDIIESWDKKKI